MVFELQHWAAAPAREIDGPSVFAKTSFWPLRGAL